MTELTKGDLQCGSRVRITHYGEDSLYVGLTGTVCHLCGDTPYVRVRLDGDPHPHFYEGPLCRPSELELLADPLAEPHPELGGVTPSLLEQL